MLVLRSLNWEHPNSVLAVFDRLSSVTSQVEIDMAFAAARGRQVQKARRLFRAFFSVEKSVLGSTRASGLYRQALLYYVL